MSVEELAAAQTQGLGPFYHAAALLQASPEFLDKLPLAVYACDRDGRILWFNARAAKLWGRTPRIGDDSEKYCGSYRLYFAGRPIRHDECPMAAVLRTGKPVRGVEGRIERPDGSSIWAIVHIEPVEDECGNLVGAVNCFHETSALHHAPDELDDFFENAAVALHLVSGNGTILRANRAELRMLGYTAEEYVGRNIVEFHADRETIGEILSRLGRGEQIVDCPARLRAKDGSIRDVRITSNARIREGEVINTRCFTIDVTERLRAEELLRQQDQRLAATYEHAGIGIAEVDAEGKLRRVNTQLATLLGYRPEQLLGRSIFDSVLAANVDEDQAQFRRQVAGEIDRYTVEKRFIRSDGGQLWISVNSSSVRDCDGRFLYAVRVQHDITDRKVAEESLARHAEGQAALYEFTERLQHSGALDEVYKGALDAIRRALRCERASILLFNDAGVMKFVAWRGLSDGYRRAVEGHSPWQRGAQDPEPICIEDIETADLPDDLKSTVRGEGIAALAFIPIVTNGRLLGKFMTYYDRPHVFTGAESELSLTIARQLGLAVERVRGEAARQRAEQALRESEARKSAILQSALDGIITMDAGGKILDFNPAAEELLRRRRGDVLGKTVVETMIPERLREAHLRGLRTFLDTGEGTVVGRRVQFPVLRSDGSEFQAELSVSVARLENGRVVFTGYLRDITERKRVERAAQQLVAIVESSEDAIVSKDINGIIMTWNQGAERLFGYKAEEVIGRPITVVIPPDRLNEEPAILARIRRGERVNHFETVRRRKDGSLVDISLTISPVRDQFGNIIGASKIARNITDRKEAEAKLRDGERQLKDLLASIPTAIYTTDAQGKITYYNEAAVEFSGRTPTIGSDEWCVTWKLYWPDGSPLPHDQCPMAIALKEGRPIRNAEAIAERPDGTRVPFIPYPTPLRDANGKIVGAINMLVDVSERKQAETQQRILFNELNHRVKNNMQMLQSLLHLAGRRTRSVEAQDILREASRRIAAMAAAQQVLYGTTEATRFSAQEFLDAVCSTARQTFSREVRITCDAGDVELMNDAAMPLALILNELLTNAVKHGANGSGEASVRVGLIRQGGSFLLYVEDDGPGFDLNSVRQRSSGLQLVEGLARQLRGRFEVTQSPNTRCSVYFS